MKSCLLKTYTTIRLIQYPRTDIKLSLRYHIFIEAKGNNIQQVYKLSVIKI